jgi:branched-chain amino acid transport system ATP-binding protein
MTAIVKVDGLSKAFGGVHAIADLSFDAEPGTVQAIIGPNGAGKTTLINLLTGVYTPDRGTIEMFGQRVEQEPPERRARLGLSRTFQNLQVCMNMTAMDNVLVGAHLQLRHGILAGIVRSRRLREDDELRRDKARELIRFVGIHSDPDVPASQLSYGALKRLEIARALAGEPQLVLMDEPAAGLNPSEKGEIADLIRRVSARGTSILIIEHDMKLVMGVAHSILVLNNGRRLALGSVDDVRRDPAVIEAYLGTTDD